jgi:UPF0716 family protein affecting phage T7 exclusion
MPDHKPEDVPRAAGALRPSSLLLMVALVDLVVIVPYLFWRLSSHHLALIIACAVAGVALLSLVGLGLRLRRRGT